jgi:hypothetical protein
VSIVLLKIHYLLYLRWHSLNRFQLPTLVELLKLKIQHRIAFFLKTQSLQIFQFKIDVNLIMSMKKMCVVSIKSYLTLRVFAGRRILCS